VDDLFRLLLNVNEHLPQLRASGPNPILATAEQSGRRRSATRPCGLTCVVRRVIQAFVQRKREEEARRGVISTEHTV
jgi:hypothetical protein